MKKNNELFSKRLLKYISKKKKEEITYHEEDTLNNHSEFMNSLERQINISSDCYKYKTRIVDDRTSIEKGDSSVTLLHKDKECECSEKVFVSYSWTPESNKTWVKKLVQRLEQDGVHVIVDFKDLKLGHDKYEFMERIVTDETINKVLIVCNKTYKEKADKRIGGVGDESTIITPQIFGNTRQDKYIPIVNEYDESGKPYLPSYLASRMYADLVDFDKGYKELLENIREKVVGGISKETEQTNANALDDINEFIHPTTFFDYRMQKAFPGIRGLKEFDNPKECVDRLEILLKKPLKSSQLKMQDPIWWFRGGSNLYINNFRRLSDTKFLMNSDEIEVKRIIVYADSHYFKKFIYVEAYPEKSVGIYEKVEEGFINKMVHLYGEYHEEYAVYKDNVISREEYDDGATVINGEVIDIGSDSELRVRYLSPYNFIICAKWHPLNKNEYDRIVVNILNGMLNGTKTIDELVDLVERIPRHNMDL